MPFNYISLVFWDVLLQVTINIDILFLVFGSDDKLHPRWTCRVFRRSPSIGSRRSRKGGVMTPSGSLNIISIRKLCTYN